MPVRDLTGYRSGRLTVTAFAGLDNRSKAVWLCACECGTKRVRVGSRQLTRKPYVSSGRAHNPTRSCGCWPRGAAAKALANG